MFRIIHCVIVDISWKFHKNRFINFTLVMPTDAASRWETMKQCSQAQNSLSYHFSCCPQHCMKISWKSVCPFFHDITNSHKSRISKSDPVFKGLPQLPDCFLMVPCLMCKVGWNFHDDPFNHFSVILLTDTDFRENVEKDFMGSRG